MSMQQSYAGIISIILWVLWEVLMSMQYLHTVCVISASASSFFKIMKKARIRLYCDLRDCFIWSDCLLLQTSYVSSFWTFTDWNNATMQTMQTMLTSNFSLCVVSDKGKTWQIEHSWFMSGQIHQELNLFHLVMLQGLWFWFIT